MISTTKSEINSGITVQELYSIIIDALSKVKNNETITNDTQENPFISNSSETFEPLGEVKAIVKQNMDLFEEFEVAELSKIIIMLKRICSDTKLIYNRQRNFLSIQKPVATAKPKTSKDKSKKSSSSEELTELDGLFREESYLVTEFKIKIRDFLIFIKEFYSIYNFSMSPVQSLRVLLMGNVCNAPELNSSNKKEKKTIDKTSTSINQAKNTAKTEISENKEVKEDKANSFGIVNQDTDKNSVNNEILQRLSEIKTGPKDSDKAKDAKSENNVYKLSKDSNSSNTSVSSFTLSQTDLDQIESRSYIQNQKVDLGNISDSAGPYVFNIFNALFNFQKNNTVTFYEVSGIFNLTRTFFTDSSFVLELYKLIIKEYVLYIIRIYRGIGKLRVYETLRFAGTNIDDQNPESKESEINPSMISFKTSESKQKYENQMKNYGCTKNSSIYDAKQQSYQKFTLFDGIDTDGCKKYLDFYSALVARCCNALNGAYLELSLELPDLNRAIFVMLSIVSNINSSYFAQQFTYRELFYCAIRSIYDRDHQKILSSEDFVEIVEALIRKKLNWKLVDENRNFSMNTIFEIYFKSDYTKIIGKIRNTKEYVNKSLFYRMNYQIGNRDLKIRLPNKNYCIPNGGIYKVNEDDTSRILITNVVHNTPKNNKTTEVLAFSPFSRRIGEKTKEKDGFKSSRKLKFN